MRLPRDSQLVRHSGEDSMHVFDNGWLDLGAPPRPANPVETFPCIKTNRARRAALSRSDVNQTPVSATTTRERNTRHGEPCCTSGTRAFPGRTWPGYRCVYAPLNKYTYTRASYRLLPLSFYLSKYRHPSNKFSNLLRISKFNFQ